MFENNNGNYGGAIYMGIDSFVSFEDSSTTVFRDNIGEYGGAIFSLGNGYIFLKTILK